MLILRILPLGAHAVLEEVVVGLESQVRDRGNVVLGGEESAGARHIGRRQAYIDAPELLDRPKGDDLLQQLVPVVALLPKSASPDPHQPCGAGVSTNLSAGGLGEPQRPLVRQGMNRVEVLLVVKDGHGVARVLGRRARGGIAAIGRDGDGGEVDLLGHLDNRCSVARGGFWRRVAGRLGRLSY